MMLKIRSFYKLLWVKCRELLNSLTTVLPSEVIHPRYSKINKQTLFVRNMLKLAAIPWEIEHCSCCIVETRVVYIICSAIYNAMREPFASSEHISLPLDIVPSKYEVKSARKSSHGPRKGCSVTTSVLFPASVLFTASVTPGWGVVVAVMLGWKKDDIQHLNVPCMYLDCWQNVPAVSLSVSLSVFLSVSMSVLVSLSISISVSVSVWWLTVSTMTMVGLASAYRWMTKNSPLLSKLGGLSVPQIGPIVWKYATVFYITFITINDL